MELQDYDGQCVQLTDQDGTVFEGICQYNSEEYNEHAFGKAEDGLEIENFLFYRSGIQSVGSLEGRSGPYGRFSSPYGVLEELNLQDGIISVETALESEEPEHVRRMLRCLAAHWKEPLPDRDAICAALQALAECTLDPEIRSQTANLLK